MFFQACRGFVLLCLIVPFTALAQEADARLMVELAADEAMQGGGETGILLTRALPVLWDRIVPVAQRARADALGKSGRMLARIVPGRDRTLVEFHAERVFAALREAHIPTLVAPPRFHLLISVRNMPGQEMQQTNRLLIEEAARIAALRGIELSDAGNGLVLSWQWLDAQHVELSVRGQTRLAEFVETREMTDADSLPAMQAWLDEVLLKARDAYAFDADAALGEAADRSAMQHASIKLTVQRGGSLLEQVALEDSLARDPRVRRITPVALNSGMQSYALQLEAGDASWLAEWFARRGYRLDRQLDGSLVAQ